MNGKTRGGIDQLRFASGWGGACKNQSLRGLGKQLNGTGTLSPHDRAQCSCVHIA